MPDTTDLYTTVKNISGASRFFAYLGKHGRTLADDATYSVYGGMVESFKGNDIKRAAFERDLLAGYLAVVKTPLPILQDTAVDAACANPTVQATAATSTGGSLAVGYYKFAYTFVNTWGESTVGTSLSAALSIPDATNDRAVITVPDPAGVTSCVSINVYATAMAATGGDVDAATLRKVGSVAAAATTLNLDTLPAVGPSNPAPPTANTTDAADCRGVKLTDNALTTVDPSWGRLTS